MFQTLLNVAITSSLFMACQCLYVFNVQESPLPSSTEMPSTEEPLPPSAHGFSSFLYGLGAMTDDFE